MAKVADNKPVVWIVGAGDAMGMGLARRFAQGGCQVALTRRQELPLRQQVEQLRSEGWDAWAFAADARREEQVSSTLLAIEQSCGPIDVLIFNVGANVPCSILEETPRKYFKVWEMACFAGFLVSQAVARRMVQRFENDLPLADKGSGTILFTGATASLRGRAHFAAFSGAKQALRALAQSMAKELGPRHIHVAHIVIDGMVDSGFIRSQFADVHAERMAQEGILHPEHVAEAYWQLYCQPRAAWTFELDVRPWMEPWT